MADAKEIRVQFGIGGFTCLHPGHDLTEFRNMDLCEKCREAVLNGAAIVRLDVNGEIMDA